jgi:hypothetical protein
MVSSSPTVRASARTAAKLNAGRGGRTRCSNCLYTSRKVFTIDIPTGTVAIVYKLDGRDEGYRPIS